MSEDPEDRRPVFEYSVRDQRHWRRLGDLFEAEGLGPRELLTNWSSYVRRRDLSRFLAHYELFKLAADKPGSIIEVGVYRGASLFTWSKLLETFCPADRTRLVYGFDHFMGLVNHSSEDKGKAGRSAPGKERWKAPVEHVRELVDLHNDDGMIAGVERVRLIEGDVLETLPRFVTDNPGLRVSLLHLDADLHDPTRAALDFVYPLLVPGGIVCIDEYGMVPWEGEASAVDRFLDTLERRPEMNRFPFSARPGGYFIKE